MNLRLKKSFNELKTVELNLVFKNMINSKKINLSKRIKSNNAIVMKYHLFYQVNREWQDAILWRPIRVLKK